MLTNNELHEILKNLCIWGETTDADEKNSLLIAKTLFELPEDVRMKVIDDRVLFIHTEAHGTIGRGFFAEGAEVPFILLNFRGIKDDRDKMNTVAHEIAHYILGHDLDGVSEDYSENNIEKAADDLTENWGFGRAYGSYNF